MRKICLDHCNGSKTIVYDESDVDFDEYCNSLSKLLIINNISLLQSTYSTAIVRPSQIQSILVQEVEAKDEEPKIEKEIKDPLKGDQKIKDSITDK